MKQLISRLDDAMFNSILRDSADEMPTDIPSLIRSDILPTPAGKASLGAGAELKKRSKLSFT